MKKTMIIMTAAVFSVGIALGQQKLDVQGHRGGMGLMPENTIASMINGVKVGAKTLELDVVISKDGKVVVSHDPYMSADIMLKPDGSEITREEQMKMPLYSMTYDSIARFDAGTKPHPHFPEQARLKTYKPLLTALIDSVETYVKKNKLKPVYYNIETKCSPTGDGVYNPAPQEFVDKMMAVLRSKKLGKRLTIQSFDVRTLQILHKTDPKVKLSLLVFGKMDPSVELKKVGLTAEDEKRIKAAIAAYGQGGIDADLKKLGFTPDVYSPYFTSVDKEMVEKAHALKMEVLPWTVDEVKDMKALGDLGVDGIISNYPDRLVKLYGNYQGK
ncbi:MAG: glycerophosphodiester phosphodiesterase family protein [Mucilaginibacter sp.]|uniref:glycerophosphodiester phosphodiesterase family protein n=1 Tax=Mucilaginibacter sp. TaxID=1882438 RepID=UPI0031A7A932